MTEKDLKGESNEDADGAQKKSRSVTLWERRAYNAALREEIIGILREAGNAWMAAQDIAVAVNNKTRRPRLDDGDVTIQRIRRQTRNYANIFERQGCRVRLRADPARAPIPVKDLDVESDE